jgi:hypothetical protein
MSLRRKRAVGCCIHTSIVIVIDFSPPTMRAGARGGGGRSSSSPPLDGQYGAGDDVRSLHVAAAEQHDMC